MVSHQPKLNTLTSEGGHDVKFQATINIKQKPTAIPTLKAKASEERVTELLSKALALLFERDPEAKAELGELFVEQTVQVTEGDAV
jgi:hypothetical protein